MIFCRINITSSCNLACKHCHAQNYTVEKKFMDYNTMDYSIKSMLELLKSKGEEGVIFSIYGGEPLLNKNNLFKAIEKYKNNYKGVNISWIINTNGTLLKEEDMPVLKRYDVDLHISLDGPREIHNLTRLDKKGNGTFDYSVKALELANQHNLRRQINSYVMPSNIKNLKQLVDVAILYKVDRIFLDWLYSKEDVLSPEEVVHKYLIALKYGELHGVIISGPWNKVWSRCKNKTPKRFNNQDLLHYVEILPSGYFFLRMFPLTRKNPFPITKLKDMTESNKWNEFIQACAKYFRKRCSGCFLRNYCFGTAIVQYQYHTFESSNYKNICECTKKLIPKLLSPSEKPDSGHKASAVQVNVTYDCNRNCSFCYVKDFLNKNNSMKLNDFNALLNWLEKNQIRALNLTGGEPTVHTNIIDMLKMARSRGFSVNLFTNGLFDNSILNDLDKINGFLLNLNEKKQYSENEWEILNKNLQAISEHKPVSIMFCVSNNLDNCDHVLEVCHNYDIDYVLLDVTHPNSLQTNTYIANEELLKQKDKLIMFIKELTLNSIRVELSRPIPYCIFSEEERRYLFYGHNLRGTCKPGFSLVSVNPDLTVYPCLSIFIRGPKITDFASFESYNRFYSRCIDELKWERTLFEECLNCHFFEKQECQGSCVCRKSKGFRVIKKDKFTLYTQYEEDKQFVEMLQRVINKLEAYFGKQTPFEIVKLDNKNDLRLFSNTYKYPEWVKGFASANAYYQVGHLKNENRLIHEICHLFIGKKATGSLPNWFNEGLCEYMAFGEDVNKKLFTLMNHKKLVPFYEMTGVYEKSLLEFDNSHPDQNIAYQQAASLVGFIINEMGFNHILDIIKYEGDFYKTLEQELGMNFKDLVNKWEMILA